jgi:hypothetical protein
MESFAQRPQASAPGCQLPDSRTIFIAGVPKNCRSIGGKPAVLLPPTAEKYELHWTFFTFKSQPSPRQTVSSFSHWCQLSVTPEWAGFDRHNGQQDTETLPRKLMLCSLVGAIFPISSGAMT